jgi:two-component system OmpR family sensor kinase
MNGPQSGAGPGSPRAAARGGRRWPRRWLARRTLRGRLIAGLLTLLLVACAAVGIVTYIALHGALMSQVDQQLANASQRYAHCEEGGAQDGQDQENVPGGGPPHPPPCQPGEILGLMPGTFTAMISHGKVSDSHVTLGHCHLTAADHVTLTALPANSQPITRSLSSLGPYRLTATPAPKNATLITGLPLASVNSTLRNVEIAEIMVFAAALLLTGFIGTEFVRRSLRPLRRVAATATRVTELPLASGEVTLPDRVPDADPRTEVGQVGSAFNRMLGHVEAALARRAASETRLRRFAADASHELRTPLAAIRGYAELARRHPGPVPDDIAHALDRVESESARMSVLVDELLLLAQLDAGRPLAKEPVDLTRLAIDATSDARAASPDHRWLLELPDEPVHVLGDEHRLHQVLANLMSNGAKHTPPGTAVTAAVTPGEDPGTVRLSVTDDGPGIPGELQPALFERFVRGDSARSNGGASTGLGLAIVQAVTSAHGGTVGVTSQPGRTSFTITLPRLAPRDPVPAP